MKLDQVQIQNFRNLSSVVLTPSADINFLFGQNGSGKSSFLEALHYLGFARSFRTNKHKNVIQNDKHEFSVFGRCIDNQGVQIKIGISRSSDDKVKVSVDGKRSNKTSELVTHLPVLIFTPQSSDLVIGSPGLRRKYLDWGLFHVEQSFGYLSSNYKRVLKNKNALLKSQGKGAITDISQVKFWDDQIISLGEKITSMRFDYLESLRGHLIVYLEQFLPEFSFEISYHRGWEKDKSLAEAVNAKNQKDTKFGFLSVGPHKADISIKTKGVNASEVLSRGQLRMLVAGFQLAQVELLKKMTSKNSVFLLDDVGAELDSSKREVFIDKLLDSNAQVFVTAIESQQVNFINKYKNKKMFHVEHGHVKEEI